MKEKIIIFIGGLLLGAIISTGSIYFYTVANKDSNSNNQIENRDRGNMPDMNNGERPEMPNNGNMTPPTNGA